jgi:hypothetical protein
MAIIIALDVTGSMGSVPHHLVKEGLPNIMESIMKAGLKDPQILFLAIGDHTCDHAPLQVGQFETNDELLDKWLTDTWLEGHGGANEGESYSLAWYFASRHTAIDCFEKRGQKGYLFTIGDEPVLRDISASALKKIMGEGQYDNITASELLDKAREKYNVYHLHIKQTRAGSIPSTVDNWKQLMQDSLVVIERHEDVAKTIANIITKGVSVEQPSTEKEPTTDKKPHKML